MAVVRIFQTLRDKVKKEGGLLPMEERAMFWFKDYATALTKWQSRFSDYGWNRLNAAEFTKQVVQPTNVRPGFLYFYLYDPKWKKTLPYYDTFPFTLVLNVYPDGFLGLNFHYLSYGDRARFFDALYHFREGRKPSKNEDRSQVRDIRMQLKVTYAILKVTSKYKPYKPCIKRYLTDHLKTPLLKVGAREWDVALFLPVHNFKKKTADQVWRISKRKI